MVIFMSIYIHIPFCSSICSYCDFCKIIYDKKYVSSYLDNLENEIRERYKGEEVTTIYIGGGTPNCLDDSELIRLFDIISIFNVSDDLEFSMECNIECISDSGLNIMKRGGVNRVSIGVQSFDDDVISLLGRGHTRKMVFDNIKLVKKYFDNVNIDLIYAAYSDIDILKRDIDDVLALDVSHISTYSLILEDHTMLKVKGFSSIDEDIDYEMYKYINDTLVSNGYVHYEVSNYAKLGFESKHNLVYWNNNCYYGFGVSSVSFVYDTRYFNTKNLHEYLRGNYLSYSEYEDVDVRMENEVMLGLRKFSGISFDSFYDKYGKNIGDVFNINDLVNCGYLNICDGYLKINSEYMYISNEIIVRMFK